MIIYPAIDVLDGHCVRLLRGEFDQVTTFADDAVAIAQRWRDEGAEWLHIIDLSGAKNGRPMHLSLIEAIAHATKLPIRLGGGLRTLADIQSAFDVGATTVALGTAALDRVLLQAATEKWGERIEVALDQRRDHVAIDGWQQESAIPAAEWVRVAVQLGVRSFLVTDITRDGTMSGANASLVKATQDAADHVPIAVTIAGGVTTIEDIRVLVKSGAAGAVIGRSLYEGRISLAAAIQAAREASC